jgi:hypothetical protein
MTALLQLIFLIFSVVGAAMALFVIKRSLWRWVVGSIFGLLALVAGILIFATSEKSITPTDIAKEMAGGDNFCFLEPLISDPKNLTGPVIIKLKNIGSTPIPRLQFLVSPYWIHGDAQGHANDYYSIMNRSSSVDCNVGASFFNVMKNDGSIDQLKLKPGRYRVEFTTTFGTGWVEILTIEQSFDRLVGVVDVFKPGKKPYHSPRPPGYVEWGKLP